MIEPTDDIKKIILLCKGHHRLIDNLEAVRIFIGKWSGMDKDDVHEVTIYRFLLATMQEILTKDDLCDFIDGLFRFDKTLDREAVMRRMIAKIAGVKVKENGEVLINLELKEMI